MIATTLTWYSVKEKLPSPQDNVAFIVVDTYKEKQLLLGYYNVDTNRFVEEDNKLNDVSFWDPSCVIKWAAATFEQMNSIKCSYYTLKQNNFPLLE